MRKSNSFIKFTNETNLVSFHSKPFSTVYHQNYINKKVEELGAQLDKISLDSGFAAAELDGVLAWFEYVDKWINSGLKKLETEKEYRGVSIQLSAPLKNIEFGESSAILGDIETARSSKQLSVALRDAREFLHLLIYRISYFPLSNKQGSLESLAA